MPRGSINITALDDYGNTQPFATVEVRRSSDNGLVTLYDAFTGGNVIANPFACGADGVGLAFAEADYHDVTVTAHGNSKSYSYVPVGDVATVLTTREVLTANRTYYVATTGSDSNDGLTVGSPFLTMQKAVDVAVTIDPAGFSVSVSVAAGSYSGSTVVLMSRPLLDRSLLSIVGDTSTPANCDVVASTRAFQVTNGGRLYVAGFRVQTTGSLSSLDVRDGGTLQYTDIIFNGSNRANIEVANNGYGLQTGDCTIAADAPWHFLVLTGSKLLNSGASTVTLSGTRAFSSRFADVSRLSMLSFFSVTITGTGTGTRYSVSENSVVRTGSGTPTTFFPGDVAGSTVTGGIIA